jgi:hypothetical protein
MRFAFPPYGVYKIIMVLPDLAWVEAESPAEKIDGGFEMLLVSIATGPAFYGHDLAV